MRTRFQLVIFMVLRTILNTAHRMVYSFLPIFARGLGVDISTISLLMTVRSLAGMTSPLLAPVADRRGRRFGMAFAFIVFTLGMGLVAVFPSIWTFGAALILGVIGKYMFDPTMQAYFGDRIPYARRGTALAVTEVAWSMAFVLGVPAMGLVISKFGWSAPFPILTVLGLFAFLVVLRIVPQSDPYHKQNSDSRAGYMAVFSSMPAIAGISIALWASVANELVNITFGVWLEDSFGLKIAALAGASAVIGLSELSGEGLVALTTDRLGKPLALTIGLVCNALASILLPFIGHSPTGALIGLFLFYISFEYVIVSHIPLMTELVPSARATILSMNVMGHSVGRTLGAFLAGFIYQQFGFTFVALTAVIFNVAGLLALRRLQKELKK